jgi:hypothetical protein
MTEDRAIALLDRPVQERADRAAVAAQVREPAPVAWSDPDVRSMRWAVLVSFLLGAYAAAFASLGVWLPP